MNKWTYTDYQRYREERLAHGKEYYQNNKEERLAYQREYYLANLEERRKYQREYDREKRRKEKEKKLNFINIMNEMLKGE